MQGLEFSAIEVNVGEPFELEVQVFEADGSPASDYSWEWDLESYGHTEDVSRTPPNTERIVITPTVADQVWVWGQIGRDDDGDGTVSWRPVRGPQLLAWGGAPERLFVGSEQVTLAVGERRPLLVQGVATRLNQGQTAQELGAGHDPTELSSSDPGVVSVSPKGLLEAHAAGTATITATYAEFTQTVEVTVDPDLVMGPPIGQLPEVNDRPALPGNGPGLVDDRGYPTFPSGRVVVPGHELHLNVPALARWTGTGVGYELVHRPSERQAGFAKIARGTDGNVWVAYHNNKFAPFGYIIVAHRPVDGGPDDWVHRELDVTQLIGDELLAFDPIHNLGLRAKPDGGVWLVVGGNGEWSVREDSGEDGRFAAFALASVTETAMTAEFLVTQPGGERLEFDGSLVVRQSEDPEYPDVLGLPLGEPPTLLSFDGQRRQWVPGSPVSAEYELPSTGLRFKSLVQAIDEDDPAKRSRLLATFTQAPSPSFENGKGLAIVLPDDLSQAVPDEEFAYDWWFNRGYASIRGDELYFVTDAGTPIWQYLMVDESDRLGYPASRTFTTVDQSGHSRTNGFDNAFAGGFRGWAFGGGFMFTAGGGFVFSKYEHPLLARDVETGRFLGRRLRNRPVAFVDGRVLWSATRPSGGGQLLAVVDDLSGTIRSHESGRSIFLEQAVDLRSVDGTLMVLMDGDQVFESIDEGENWLFAGELADLPVNPWAHIDAAGNRHTVEFDGDFVWEWTAPDGTEPIASKRLAWPERHNACREGVEMLTGTEVGRTFVTSSGSLIRCTAVTDRAQYFLARPEDEEWTPLNVGIDASRSTVGNTMFESNMWVRQVVELADGRVWFGFTGQWHDPLQKRAMLVEMSPDGQLSAPHVLRPDGGYGQEFRSMEPLPDGGVLVVLRDHGVPDINAGAGVDLVVRVDELTPDEGLLEKWIEAGLER